MNSLMTCSGQGGVGTGKRKEKECVVKDIRYNPHTNMLRA